MNRFANVLAKTSLGYVVPSQPYVEALETKCRLLETDSQTDNPNITPHGMILLLGHRRISQICLNWSGPSQSKQG